MPVTLAVYLVPEDNITIVIVVQKELDYTSENVSFHVQLVTIPPKELVMNIVTNVTPLVLPVSEVLGTTVTLVSKEDSGSNILVSKSVHSDIMLMSTPKNVNNVTPTVTAVTDLIKMTVMIVLLQDITSKILVKLHVQMVLMVSLIQRECVLLVMEPVKLVTEVIMMIVFLVITITISTKENVSHHVQLVSILTITLNLVNIVLPHVLIVLTMPSLV